MGVEDLGRQVEGLGQFPLGLTGWSLWLLSDGADAVATNSALVVNETLSEGQEASGLHALQVVDPVVRREIRADVLQGVQDPDEFAEAFYRPVTNFGSDALSSIFVLITLKTVPTCSGVSPLYCRSAR